MRIRTMSIALTALVALAACSTGESAVPGVDGSPDLGTPGNLTDQQVAEPAAPAAPSTTTDASAAVAGTDGASSTDTTTTSAAPPPAPPPPDPDTTTEADVEPAPGACESLANDGYETRKITRQGLNDAALVAVQSTCPEPLARLDDAAAVEQRMAAFNVNPTPLTATDLLCDRGSFSLTITNNVDHPIGVHASMRLVGDGTDGPVGSTLQPLVIWSLEPGATTTLADDYRVNRGSDEGLNCEVGITAFDASAGDADASLGETQVAELAVDDPAAWLPFLTAQGAAIIGAGDPDLAAVVEDIRSTEYPSVVEIAEATDAEAPATGTISVCTASIEQPDDRHMSVVYFDDGAASSRLQHGLFRRGNDDQWRWLSSSVYFDSQEYWNCGTPSSNL